MTKKPRGKSRLGKVGNGAKLYPYNEPGKEIVMLPVRTLSKMSHCVITKTQLSGRLNRSGDSVDVYREMITPMDHKCSNKKYREENKIIIKKPMNTKADKDRERLKDIYRVPVRKETTHAFYMGKFTPRQEEQTANNTEDGWKV